MKSIHSRNTCWLVLLTFAVWLFAFVPSPAMALITRSPDDGPQVQLSPASLTFPVQLIGTGSTMLQVKLTNIGSSALNITSIVVSGEFTATNNCGTVVNPSNHCTIGVKFFPKGLGIRSGTVTITDDAGDSPQTISLTGTGTDFSLQPTSLAYGDVTVGTVSKPHTATLTNVGISPQKIYSIGLGGANPKQFSLTNNCPSSLGVGQSCTLLITFAPTSVGAKSATLQVGGGGGTEVVALTGTGD